jgi:hypothetical protein
VKAIATLIAATVTAFFLGRGGAHDCVTPSDCPGSEKPACHAMCIDFGPWANGGKCFVVCSDSRQ